MKRFFALILSIVLIGLVSVTSADSIVRSDSFEFTIPDQWQCDIAEGVHVKVIRVDKSSTAESFDVREMKYEIWPDSTEGIADLLREKSGQSIKPWEEVLVSDQKTAIIYFDTPYNGFICYSAIAGEDCFALIRYISVAGHGGMDNFKSILSTFSARKDK